MSIRLLPPEIASKIAAGEVIERPASVVKELVENALDAGATRITVEVENGGKDLIRVTDDGQGIPSDELELAVARHATSKLRTVDDLLRVETLGFRGEALASMAAVAEVSIGSVTATGQAGREIVARDDRVVATRPYGGPRGTRITVRGLFQTLPARLEFLKSTRTETAQITQVALNAALGHPHVAIRLLDGDQESAQSPGSGSLRDAVLALYGHEMLDGLIEMPVGETLGIDGFMSKPSMHRASRSHISLFVNGRCVSDRLLAGAINEAYQSAIPSGRFPIVILRLTMPPSEVDVNVHPTKAEVRFRHPGEVYTRVAATLRRALTRSGEATPARFDRPVVDTIVMPIGGGAPAASRLLRPAPGQSDDLDTNGHAYAATSISSPVMRPLGQIEATYIVAAGPGGLYLIDQHAAHERVVYERMRVPTNGDGQPLLDPAVVELSAGDAEWVADHVADLKTLGMVVEPFGHSTWRVIQVPLTSRRLPDPVAYLHDVVAEMRQPDLGRLEATERLRWSLACKAAIKSGESLAMDEMRQLVDDLQRCDLSVVCPHGRPTTILLSRDLLDRQFGRT